MTYLTHYARRARHACLSHWDPGVFVYLAVPIDVIPDFIPIPGYADDAIVVVLVLRSVCRRVSVEELREAWPGSDDGFAALCQLGRSAALA